MTHTIKPNKRGDCSLSISRALKSDGVILKQVSRQFYSEDGYVTVIHIPRLDSTPETMSNIKKARASLDAIAADVVDSNAVVIRYEGSVLYCVAGQMGTKETSTILPGARRPEYFE